MSTIYLKKATHTAKTDEGNTQAIVKRMLDEIEAQG